MDNNLRGYVQRNLRQSEILDLIKVQYPMYAWSLRTLSRRLHHFGIKFTDYDVDVEEVKQRWIDQAVYLAIVRFTKRSGKGIN